MKCPKCGITILDTSPDHVHHCWSYPYLKDVPEVLNRVTDKVLNYRPKDKKKKPRKRKKYEKPKEKRE